MHTNADCDGQGTMPAIARESLGDSNARTLLATA